MHAITLSLWLGFATAADSPTAVPPPLLMVEGPARAIAGPPLPAGADWLALACTDTGCALWPARMRADPAAAAAVSESIGYDAEVPRQSVRFELAEVEIDRVIAWFHSDPALPWLRPGALASVHPVGADAAPAGGEGDFEIQLRMPSGSVERLIPVYDSADGPLELIRLRLRGRGSWQWLGILRVCNGRLDTGFLRWAGDLDGDGVSDWLVDFGMRTEAPLRLFLSSRAAPGQLVGAAVHARGDQRAANCTPW